MEKTLYLENILKLAQRAARRAGDHAHRGIGSARISIKGADQIVTQLDEECQEIIIRHIRDRYPGHGLIGEEGPNGQLLKQSPTDGGNIWWVIDPIDGTRNFAHGTANYTVSVGVIEDGIPVAGAIFDPSTDQMFTARLGGPAQCNGQTINCRDETLHKNSQIAFSGNILSELGPAPLAELMDKHVLINLGSAALHYAYVALGAYSGAFGWKTRLWDIAAGAVICQSAGAVVTDLRNNPRFPIDCRIYQGEALPILIAAESAQNQLRQIFTKKRYRPKG